MELIFIKLGGSIITDKTKPYTARLNVIRRLSKEIHEARKNKKDLKLVVGHGGGSFPHTSANNYKTHLGIINEESLRGIAIVHKDASKINEIIVNELINAGENAIPIPPIACAISKNGKIIKWDITQIKEMLRYDLIPVPYGDVSLDIKKGCCILSTEEIFYYLAKKLKPSKIILVTDVDGVYDGKGKLIPFINKSNYYKIKKYLGGSKGTDVTGGMLHKVNRMLELAKLGIKSKIINGNRPGLLKKTLLGKKTKGTEISNVTRRKLLN